MTSEKEALYATLDSFISRKGLTDLHTHLMGMGSADFWVSRIMETYLPRIMNPDKPETDVFYPLSDVLRASGFESLTPFDKELDKSVFEARFFDGFDDGTSNYNLKSVFQLKSGVLCLANQSLIKMLRFEDAKFHRSGPLRALVRNWFQFLGSNGQPAHHSEVLQIYRGNFSPGFYPQRFNMKDPIVNTRPEVLGILLNTTLARYAKAGVHYVEYSVSCGDLLDDTKFEALLDMAFNSKLSKPKPKTTSTATLHTPAPSKPPKGQKRTESASKDSGKLPRPESAQKRQKSSQPTSIPVNLEEEFGTAEPEIARFMSITDHTETELDQDIVVNTNTEPAAAARLTPSRLKDVMPSTNLKNAGPAWRLHINYIAKEPNQEYRFLAAFPRYTADKGPLCHEISGGEWRVAHAPLVSPRTAYSKLGEIASDLFEMYTFLEVQGVERAAQLPNWAEVARATRDEVNGRIFQDLCSTGNICRYLEAVAKHLCADTFLEQLYPHHLVGIDGKETKIEQMTRTIQTDEERRYLRAMVGLDWVGDELGHPFCIFSHDKFIAFVAECMVYNPNFGVRIHAGEGPIRPSTLDDKTSQVSLAFYLHMYIVCESIKIYRRKLADVLLPTGKKPNIRIGHGVAFLFGCYELNSVDPFISYLKDFRKNFLQRYKIVCELNPTSNHMLLPSTFQQGAQLQNHRTLPTFLKEKLPVVLGTDDDGIWAIHKCKCHYHHVSVAAEYCHAIDCGDITNNADLKDMLVWGRKSAFSSCKENDLNQVDEDEVVEQEEMEHSEF